MTRTRARRIPPVQTLQEVVFGQIAEARISRVLAGSLGPEPEGIAKSLHRSAVEPIRVCRSYLAEGKLALSDEAAADLEARIAQAQRQLNEASDSLGRAVALGDADASARFGYALGALGALVLADLWADALSLDIDQRQGAARRASASRTEGRRRDYQVWLAQDAKLSHVNPPLSVRARARIIHGRVQHAADGWPSRRAIYDFLRKSKGKPAR